MENKSPPHYTPHVLSISGHQAVSQGN